MLILGLFQNGNKTDFAIVADGCNLISSGSIVSTSEAEIVEFVEQESGLKLTDLDRVVTSDLHPILIDKVEAEKVDERMALNHSIWVNYKSDKIAAESPEYPYILCNDIHGTITFHLVESLDKANSFESSTNGSLSNLEKAFQDKYQQEFLSSAILGNQDYIPIQTANYDLSAESLLTEIHLKEDIVLDGASDEVKTELKNFAIFDLAANILDSYCQAIVGKLLSFAQEFAVKSIGYDGKLIYNERFREIISNASEAMNMQLRLPPVASSDNMAFALAAYANFLFESKKL